MNSKSKRRKSKQNSTSPVKSALHSINSSTNHTNPVTSMKQNTSTSLSSSPNIQSHLLRTSISSHDDQIDRFTIQSNNYNHKKNSENTHNNTSNNELSYFTFDEEDQELLELDSFPLSLSIEDHSREELEKTMSFWNGLALIIGLSIGSGIFASPGPVYMYTKSVGMGLIIWICGGLLAITGALSYAELGAMFPTSGGEHPYLMKAYGTLPAFLFSWTGILVTRPGSIAIITVVFAEYTCRLIYFSRPVDDIPSIVVRIVAIFAVVLLTAVNCFSTKLGTRIQDFFTLLKLLSLLVIGITGVVNLARGSPYMQISTLFSGSSTRPGDYALALYSALWAYDGWNNLNLVTGELKEPAKNLPRAVIAGPSVVIVCYVFANIAYYATLDPNIVMNSNSVAMDFGKQVFGSIGAILIPLVVLGSTFGSANASVFTGSRVSFVSAKHGHAPEFLCRLHPKFETPFNALILQGILSLLFVSVGSYTTLINFYSFIAWIFYLLAVCGLLILRWTEPLIHRPFRIWLPVPIIFCAATVFLIAFSAKEAPFESIGAFCFMLSGVPVWWLIVYKDIAWEDIVFFLPNKFKGIQSSRKSNFRKASTIEWQYTKFDDTDEDFEDLDSSIESIDNPFIKNMED